VDIEIRSATEADFDDIIRVDSAAFGVSYTDDDLKWARALNDFSQFVVATDAGAVVGVAGELPLTMTVPGGATLQVPGVTWVSVSPTHLRRGVLRALMAEQLDRYQAQHAPAAILTASQAGIYGRFGYGAATWIRRITIERRRAQLVAPGDFGPVALATAEQARAAMPGIHDRWAAQTPGALRRPAERWDAIVADSESRREGQSGLQYLLHDDGYLAYRSKLAWNDWNPNNLCTVAEFAAVTPPARAALWQTVFGLDLFGTVESGMLPVDDPLPHLLTDPRLVRTASLTDGVWLRPLDIVAMLSARTYGGGIDAVIEVEDERCGGRYALAGSPDGATCRRTDAPADLRMSAAVLGALYLGGNRAQQFAQAGLVQADDEALLRRFDRAMLADRAPFHGTPF
jgi:predicted acetyltransferase